MTERQDMTRLTTVKGAGRSAREHAGRPAPGWHAGILRVAGSGLLIATAAIHLDLYLTGYRTIPTIGWLFLLQVLAAFALALAVLVTGSQLAAAAGAGRARAGTPARRAGGPAAGRHPARGGGRCRGVRGRAGAARRGRGRGRGHR